MTDYSKKAAENFKKGYNCAQAVLLAFADKINLDEKTILKLTSSFGGGMGCLREVCGAVSAMFMAAGLLKGYTAPNDDEAKARHYELIQALAAEFKKHHGTIICRELLGLEKEEDGVENAAANVSERPENDAFSHIPSKRTEEYYKTRPCEEFIKTAAEILNNML